MTMHSDAYYVIRHAIIKSKREGHRLQDKWSIPNPDRYEEMTRQILHQQINQDYMNNVGVTEDELEDLHAFIDEDFDDA